MEEQEAQATSNIPQKERPIWMTESTVEGANTESMKQVIYYLGTYLKSDLKCAVLD